MKKIKSLSTCNMRRGRVGYMGWISHVRKSVCVLLETRQGRIAIDAVCRKNVIQPNAELQDWQIAFA